VHDDVRLQPQRATEPAELVRLGADEG